MSRYDSNHASTFYDAGFCFSMDNLQNRFKHIFEHPGFSGSLGFVPVQISSFVIFLITSVVSISSSLLVGRQGHALLEPAVSMPFWPSGR